MPSLGSHLATAYGLANRLGHPYIDNDRGAYYLGSTAPDIRVLLKVDRRYTHFFDLDDFCNQDSITRMFEAYPRLADSSTLDSGTRAFIAGYLTHLLMDEHYIQTIYRHFFGERSALGGGLWANVLDRVLQYEMNRRELENGTALSEIRNAIDETESHIRVDFIDSSFWSEWREFTRGITYQSPDWERFPRVMHIHLRRAGFSDEAIERVAQNPPELVQEALTHVDLNRIDQYIEEATELATDRLRSYLPTL